LGKYPYIVSAYVVVRIEDFPFIVHDYIAPDGKGRNTLSSYLGNLTLSEILKCSIEFCYGMEYAYSKGIVAHGDIKPDNIMFNLGYDEPSIVDFGLVRDLSDVSLTQSWAPMGPGTPLFASPEQLNNDKQLIKWRSDQFAIGLVLGLCLTGVHPFQDPTMDQNQVVERMTKREKCSGRFEIAARKAGFEGFIKMISPWPVQRFSALAEILEIFN